MLYKKNNTSNLSDDLFRNPTAEYRGTPFWAWNCKLDLPELERQIDVLKHMGFGGFHMHVRTGMDTEYLSDEYMHMVTACTNKAKAEGMLAWLYDEDRWPSGSAGGLVTKDKRYRERRLIFTPFKKPCGEDIKLLACYDVKLNQYGYLCNSKIIDENENADFEKWYAYLALRKEEAWYNNQSYVNTLDKSAMDRFIEITYECYNKYVSKEFDKTIPAIFTDEPQFALKSTLKFATEKAEVVLPWTDDLAESFSKAYVGESLIDGLPELIWERADKIPSKLRYHYHDHVCERFVNAFADNCGAWCHKHGLALTGHMMEEPTLKSQTAALGEAMRSYRSFDLPGIDMLCARFEYTTAKQAQSAVHQFGKEGMMSELYGVTNWDFDFRDYKLHGDWQAALGGTVRVPHLSWVSMAGEAKRDYPPSINYQSPWWKKYSFIENHYARLNTALTRGKPIVNVGIIHPVESYWLHWGPSEQTALVRNRMDDNFINITDWLLFGSIDFDFISESLLPQLVNENNPFCVGKMKYDAIIVPECETLRSTTLDFLEEYSKNGGRLIFAGKPPVLENAVKSSRGSLLAKSCTRISFNKSAVLEALEDIRNIEIRNQTGMLTNNLFYQLRQDGDRRWLFIAHAKEPYNKDVSSYQDIKISVSGKWTAKVYNTLNGDIFDVENISISNNKTVISYRIYDYDSLLLLLESKKGNDRIFALKRSECDYEIRKPILNDYMDYTLSEPNVLVLDRADYSLDGGVWFEKEEILRLDDACRQKLGWASRKEAVVQPWTIEEKPIEHFLRLRFNVLSETECDDIHLAIEDLEKCEISWNEISVPSVADGWYTDKSIKTVKLTKLLKGMNILEVKIPFGERTNTEWAYLLGNFGVRVSGKTTCIIPAPKKITFGSIISQGFPFYGGNIVYHIPFKSDGGELCIRSSQYRGSLQTANIDGSKEQQMIFPPYTVNIPDISAGEHILNLKLYGNRYNAFGPLHLTDRKEKWIGPEAWRSEDEKWSYEYVLKDIGVLTSPEIAVRRKKNV